eukprot:UN09599
MLDQSFTNRKIEFLMKAMRQWGCDVDRSFFQCVLCDEDDLGGLELKGKPRIRLCCNHEALIDNRDAFLANMTHHMVNAFDYARADMSFT